jgi:hypothetical protein
VAPDLRPRGRHRPKVLRSTAPGAEEGLAWLKAETRWWQSGEEDEMAFLFGAIYIVLLITLGIISIRKGHWVMFIIGLFIPLFWIIGALLPSRDRLTR